MSRVLGGGSAGVLDFQPRHSRESFLAAYQIGRRGIVAAILMIVASCCTGFLLQADDYAGLSSDVLDGSRGRNPNAVLDQASCNGMNMADPTCLKPQPPCFTCEQETTTITKYTDIPNGGYDYLVATGTNCSRMRLGQCENGVCSYFGFGSLNCIYQFNVSVQ